MSRKGRTDEAIGRGEPIRAAHAGEIPLIRTGYEEKRARLQMLVTDGRQRVAEYLHATQDSCDALESGAYEDAKQAQALLEGEIRELELILVQAVILNAPEHVDDHLGSIQLGSVVDVDAPRGRKVFTLVSTVEADTTRGKISDESPVGRALLGLSEGEQVEIMTPNGAAQYTIRAIHRCANPLACMPLDDASPANASSKPPARTGSALPQCRG